MYAGVGPFKEIGPIPLRLLVELNGHLLVTVESFRDRHAFLLAKAIEHIGLALQTAASSSRFMIIPGHPGAATYSRTRAQEPRKD